MNEVTLESPIDAHVHLREGTILSEIAHLTVQHFGSALIMPNLIEPITTKKQLQTYVEAIEIAVDRKLKDYLFDPLMTLFFKPNYTRSFLEDAYDHFTAIKLYPDGITTNSEGGVKDARDEKLYPIYEAMQDLEIPLCIHGETNDFILHREKNFLPTYAFLAENFPRLKIIMEHITTRDAVMMLDRFENIYATVTVHHLLITLDDVMGDLLRPHLFCKPVAKEPEDRAALRTAVLSGHPKIMLGTDSAPHPKHKKECCGCAAGVFTAPIALQLLCQFFDEHTPDALKHNTKINLEKFVTHNARKIYQFSPPVKEITLAKEKFRVPHRYGKVIPMYAGQEIEWSVKHILN